MRKKKKREENKWRGKAKEIENKDKGIENTKRAERCQRNSKHTRKKRIQQSKSVDTGQCSERAENSRFA